MSTIHSSWALRGLQVGAERRQRQVQHRQVHRVEQARQRDHREPDPLSPPGHGRLADHSPTFVLRGGRITTIVSSPRYERRAACKSLSIAGFSGPRALHLLPFASLGLPRQAPRMTAMSSSFTSQSPAWMVASIHGTCS